jgi:hypothetical protein
MRRRFLNAALLLLLLCDEGSSYDKERAKANLADDFATCATYYLTMAEGAKTAKKADVSKAMEHMGTLAMSLAIELSNEKVTSARMELTVQEMAHETDHNWSNSAILINKYGQLCKHLIEKPTDRLQYWLERRD